MIPGHNIPQAGVGFFAMLAGWAPCVAGCLFATGSRSTPGLQRRSRSFQAAPRA